MSDLPRPAGAPEPGAAARFEAEPAPTVGAPGTDPGTDPAAGPAAGPDSASTPPVTGPALARAVLDAAQARRGGGDRRSGAGRRRGGAPDRAIGRSSRGWSGPGPDPRDPQPFGAVLAKLLKDRGWQRPAAEATLFARWEQVVGAEVAAHCRPVRLADGELTVEAVSTAWATQLRLLAGKLLKQVASVVGHNVVTKLRIHGPAVPSWQRGPLRVRGRGPRDTYG